MTDKSGPSTDGAVLLSPPGEPTPPHVCPDAISNHIATGGLVLIGLVCVVCVGFQGKAAHDVLPYAVTTVVGILGGFVSRLMQGQGGAKAK